jgi:predicted metal-dependent hydrolase
MPKLSFQKDVKAGPDTLTVKVDLDTRLRKSARWTLYGHIVHLRVPKDMTSGEIDKVIQNILPRIARQRKRARRQNDNSLTVRATALNERYFNDELTWHTIRWVDNMKHRLGSCTTGGATDGDIRISERIRHWPDYVIDYIIAHEIAHRKYPNHSAEFWEYLSRYPMTAKAIGFLEGIAYAEGADPSGLID